MNQRIKLLAKPRRSRKPKTSVKVVIIMEEATAGSIPILLRIRGMAEPEIPAIMRLPVIAIKITRPSIAFWS